MMRTMRTKIWTRWMGSRFLDEGLDVGDKIDETQKDVIVIEDKADEMSKK